MKGWKAPYTNERLQMTMQGIVSDIGDRKMKKPPVEARHVAALVGMVRPIEWTLHFGRRQPVASPYCSHPPRLT